MSLFDGKMVCWTCHKVWFVTDNEHWTNICKDCQRHINLTRHPKITEENYNILLEKQNHRCAICLSLDSACWLPAARRYGLVVDHDHSTGKIRGLLCDTCNRYIGRRQCALDRLKRTVAYLDAK